MSQLLSQACKFSVIVLVAAGFALCFGAGIGAQSPPTLPPPLPYGVALSLSQAKQVLAAAEATAVENGWSVAIAIVDPAGFLIAFERMDNTQLASVEIGLKKAKSAALFRRPTKYFEDTLALGGANLKVLKLPEAMPIEGGLPIVLEGQIIGGIGVSGAKSTEDAQIAAAGIKALLKPSARDGAESK